MVITVVDKCDRYLSIGDREGDREREREKQATSFLLFYYLTTLPTSTRPPPSSFSRGLPADAWLCIYVGEIPGPGPRNFGGSV